MAAEKKRIGRQTPTKSFVLPYKKSLSDEAVALYSQTGRTAMEWQSLLLKDIMAVNDDGCWTHMTVGYSIPRRNGKTEDVYMREIWGLHKGEQILHTAHENSTSHASFESLVDLLNAMGYEEKKDYIKNSALGNERITMIETKGVIKYRTRTKVGGLGLGFDLLVVDEAQEYTDTHRSALEYTISSSQNPQAIMLGTPPRRRVQRGRFLYSTETPACPDRQKIPCGPNGPSNRLPRTGRRRISGTKQIRRLARLSRSETCAESLARKKSTLTSGDLVSGLHTVSHPRSQSQNGITSKPKK